MRNATVRRTGTWGKAVVIGGGYAGLVTARVLADHFADVVILEQDPVDGRTGNHAHVPQGYHAHGLLAKGGQILEGLFPGLRAELLEIGAPVFDYGERMSFLLPCGFAPRGHTGVEVQTVTRDELERRLRGKVLALPQVTLLAATRCEGLAMSAPGRANRVRYLTEGADAPVEVEADLVVNTTGRSSVLDTWLAELGLSVPEKRVVRAKVTYTSMNFDRPDASHADFHLAYQMTFAPSVPRGGVILAVEHGRWMCSLVGYEDQAPPAEDAGFMEFARSLKNHDLAEQIEHRTNQGPTRRYTNANNQWRLYHRMKDWPERLVALGDAVCVLNPVYGQGMTLAAVEADLLSRALADRAARGGGLDGLSRSYQRAVARALLTPWSLSTTSDLLWEPRDQPLVARIAHWYNTHLFEVSVRDIGVWSRFVRVANMMAPPTVLFSPTVIAKVLARVLSGGARAAKDPAEQR